MTQSLEDIQKCSYDLITDSIEIALTSFYFWAFGVFLFALTDGKWQMATTPMNPTSFTTRQRRSYHHKRLQHSWEIARKRVCKVKLMVTAKPVDSRKNSLRLHACLHFILLFLAKFEVALNDACMHVSELLACRWNMQTFSRRDLLEFAARRCFLNIYLWPKRARVEICIAPKKKQQFWRRFIDVRCRTIEGRIIDCPKKARALEISIWWSHGFFVWALRFAFFLLPPGEIFIHNKTSKAVCGSGDNNSISFMKSA